MGTMQTSNFLLAASVLILTLCVPAQTSEKTNEEILTSPDIVDDLIKKLFRMCKETESISLWECEKEMVKNDKRIGNYRNGFNYTRETIYMMATFDKNKDSRLNYRELYFMGGEIMEGNTADHFITKKLKELEESGWAKENMDKYYRPYTLEEVDAELEAEKKAKQDKSPHK